MWSMNEIFIRGNVPSSKNSKVNGKFFSKTVQKYLRYHGIKSFSSRKKTVERYKTIPMTFPVKKLKALFKSKNPPFIVSFHFVRDSKRKFDFGNITQILFDLMTAFDIIEDDNMDITVPAAYKKDSRWYSLDKDNPGVYIKVEEDEKEV